MGLADASRGVCHDRREPAPPSAGRRLCSGSARDDVPWLSAEQQAWWRAYLVGAARLTEALGRQLERDSGLSLSEYEVMVRLSEAPGHTLRMAELADSLVHSRSRLTHAVCRMERRGLVERRACELGRPRDQRAPDRGRPGRAGRGRARSRASGA